jgi:hypothetical protein
MGGKRASLLAEVLAVVLAVDRLDSGLVHRLGILEIAETWGRMLTSGRLRSR